VNGLGCLLRLDRQRLAGKCKSDLKPWTTVIAYYIIIIIINHRLVVDASQLQHLLLHLLSTSYAVSSHLKEAVPDNKGCCSTSYVSQQQQTNWSAPAVSFVIQQ
jgi:hypothetical protein